jgi:hypothetical protein
VKELNINWDASDAYIEKILSFILEKFSNLSKFDAGPISSHTKGYKELNEECNI